jgi:hypothetical protein
MRNKIIGKRGLRRRIGTRGSSPDRRNRPRPPRRRPRRRRRLRRRRIRR